MRTVLKRIVLSTINVYQRFIVVVSLRFVKKEGNKTFIGCADIANNLKAMKDIYGEECITVSKRKNRFYDSRPDIRFILYEKNDEYSEMIKMLMAPFVFLYCLAKCKVFLYFWDEALLLDRDFEFKIVKRWNKILINRYLGCDIRHWEPALRETDEGGMLHVCSLCGYAFTNDCNKEKKMKSARESENYADIIYSNAAMPSFLKRDFKTIKVPIDVNKYPFSFRMNDIPTIIHAPSNPILKGTPLIRYGLKQLQKAGYKFKYVELRGKANSIVLGELQKSHIVIDKICGAGIGLFPLEAMACGNVVLGVADIDYHTSRGEDCPVIQINPMNFVEKVRWTLDHPEEWEALAVRGRKYVENYHDKDVVEMQLKNDIQDVMNE